MSHSFFMKENMERHKREFCSERIFDKNDPSIIDLTGADESEHKV